MSTRPEVVFLRWPAQSQERTRLREAGVPALLIVEGGVNPPTDVAPTEDWVRQPIPRCDIEARVSVLRQRTADTVPVLDPAGVLYYAGESVPMSNAQVAMMHCFLADFRRVVRRGELQEALADIRVGFSNNALDLHILRLRKRIARLSLELRTVWGRGYILGWAASEARSAPENPVHRVRVSS
ncbi:helix-turn-helix domain-containing protein [Actinopolyspora sp. H202]|uniref:helix-turn-helix domain-containing protein n=1 Tax=Actinopolyspora sp. H202 TaxID=1500456 RepID=UPI003EE43D38